MAFHDPLLVALTYPDATPDRALRNGVALAKRLAGSLTLLTVQIDIPEVGNWFSNRLFHFDQVAAETEARSAALAKAKAMCARIAAEEAGAGIEIESTVARLFDEADVIARLARTRDLTLIAVGAEVLAARSLAEKLVFASGRPVLIYPEELEVVAAEGFDTVAIAWDGGASAARAVAAATPLMRKARSVRIFVAPGEKAQASATGAEELARHLGRHGFRPMVDARTSDRPIAAQLLDYVQERPLDLLVMGGFGHARLQEFILGGATQAMLESPPCPILMTH